MKNLNDNEYIGYFKYYINLNTENEVITGLEKTLFSTEAFFKNIPSEKLNYQYAVGKWSIKDILQHLIDTERIFAYRALSFARFDETNLPGFDENKYADHVDTTEKSIESLLEEYKLQRLNTILLFKSFSSENLQNLGSANGNKNSVRALGFLIPGHETHHINIIKERYL